MPLRTRYILFIILIHAAALAMSFFIFEENKLIFIASEVIILLSLFFSIRLYRALVQPLRLILDGIEAIRDRDFNVRFLKTGSYETDQLVAVYNQMIDELRHERRRQEEQHYFLEKLIHSSPTGILILDFDERIADMNPQAQQLLGLNGVPYQKMPLQEVPNPLAQKIARLPAESAETFFMNGVETYKCRRSHFIDRGFPRHFIMIEELTADILQTEKKAYGKVIRMMAHEVNNSIGPINSILESLLFYKNQLQIADQQDFNNVINVAIQRNERLNQFMRNFAEVVRLPLPARENTDLRDLVHSTVTLLQAEARRRRIHLHIALPERPVPALCDLRQMEQVLVNIARNALESIGEDGEVQFLIQENPLQLLVRDNGAGIAPELADKLFSPFFSTKKDGQGIGLTLIREILLNHGFSFSLQTEADSGWTVFRIGFSVMGQNGG